MLAQSLIASKNLSVQDETSKNINIENFDVAEFENSKYVLTSPRSLIACENLNIRPNEILPKSFSEIYSQIGRDQVSLPLAYRIFSKQEIERKIKIARIKLERFCIIKNDVELSRSLTEPLLMSTVLKNLNNQSIAKSQRQQAKLSEEKLQKRLQLLEDRISILKDNELKILQPYLADKIKALSSNDLSDEKSDFMHFKEENYSPKVESTQKKVSSSSFLNEKCLNIQKQKDFEANLSKALAKSKKISQETDFYYRNKLSNTLNVMDSAKKKKEKILNEKSLMLNQKRQDKFRAVSGNLTKKQKMSLMRSLHDLSKIKQKDAIINSKL